MTEEQFRQHCYELALNQLALLFGEMYGLSVHPVRFALRDVRQAEESICRVLSQLITDSPVESADMVQEVLGTEKSQFRQACMVQGMREQLVKHGLIGPPPTTPVQ